MVHGLNRRISNLNYNKEEVTVRNLPKGNGHSILGLSNRVVSSFKY